LIDKLTAARREIECAIRLVAATEDELAIHTLVMAAFGILRDLSAGRTYYERGVKPHLTAMGKRRLSQAANFLKHADRDPKAALKPFPHEENDWRIGFCLILYRDLAGAFTPAMAAFHAWMVIRHPDHFQLAEDEDKEIERAYREGNEIVQSDGRDIKIVLLQALLEVFNRGLLPASIGYKRKSIDSLGMIG
jgi:hypothetical protein